MLFIGFRAVAAGYDNVTENQTVFEKHIRLLPKFIKNELNRNTSYALINVFISHTRIVDTFGLFYSSFMHTTDILALSRRKKYVCNAFFSHFLFRYYTLVVCYIFVLHTQYSEFLANIFLLRIIRPPS